MVGDCNLFKGLENESRRCINSVAEKEKVVISPRGFNASLFVYISI